MEDEAETETDGDDGDFEKLGYAPGHFIKGMREGDDRGSRREHKEYFKELGSCPPLQRAVDALPPRPYTGMSTPWLVSRDRTDKTRLPGP